MRKGREVRERKGKESHPEGEYGGGPDTCGECDKTEKPSVELSQDVGAS